MAKKSRKATRLEESQKCRSNMNESLLSKLWVGNFIKVFILYIIR